MRSIIVMPGINGQRLAEQLTQYCPDLKTLFMSGYTDSALESYGGMDSDSPFLQKPFSSGALVRKARDVLDG